MSKFKDVLLFFGGTLTNQALTFASGVFVARWLGPSDYGVLSLVRNVFGVAMILAPLGLDLSLLRHLGENGDDWPKSLAQVRRFRVWTLLFNLTAAVAAVGLLGPWIGAHVYHHAHFSLYLGLAFLALPFTADVAILGATLRALNKVSFQNLAALYLQPLVRLGSMALFLVLGLGVGGVVASTAVGVAASCLAMSLAVSAISRKQHPQRYELSSFDTAVMRKVLGYSAWLMVMLFCYNILRNIDILVLGKFRSTKDVGEYAALSTIAYTIQIFPLAVSQTLAPAVARRYATGDLDGVRSELQDYLRRAVLLASPIFAGVAVFGPWLDLLFGNRFHFSGSLSVCLACAYFVSGTLGQMGVALTMSGRHRIELLVLVIGTIGSLGACILLAPRFGGPGVALAVTGGYFFINVTRSVLTARLIGGIGIKLVDGLPPLLCLATAFAWRTILDGILPHTLSVGVFGAVGLLVIFALLYGCVFLRPSEKAYLAARIGKPLTTTT